MFTALKSIRAKLTLWYSFVVLTTLVLFGLISYVYLRDQLIENLDRSLAQEVQWVNDFIKEKANRVKPSKKFATKKKQVPSKDDVRFQLQEPDRADADDEIWTQIYEHALLNSSKTIIEVTDKHGDVIFRSISMPEEPPVLGEVPLNMTKMITVQAGSQELRVAATTTETLNIYAAYPLGELTGVLDNLFSIFLILIPIALTVSIGGGLFLAYTSLRPVDLVTRIAQRITVEHLDQQIPSRQVDDELGRLISTFNSMIMRLRSSFDQIKQFTMDASHELRTPLTIMRGEAEIALRSQKEPEEYRRVLASSLEENFRLATIIDNLSTLSKADLGKHDVLFEEVNVRQMIEELCEDCKIIAEKKQIEVELEKQDNAMIMGDGIRLRQLFLKLIENAVKFTPEKGRVALAVEREDGVVKVMVADTGIGIPKEEQEKIFDRFYRVDKARSRALGGSGLGLSIAKWIVEIHHGRIEVESEVNRGTKFTVVLPLE
jgi:heavy metal sensor kinase